MWLHCCQKVKADDNRYKQVYIDREVRFMRQLVLYIHGKGGNAMEADHYLQDMMW